MLDKLRFSPEVLGRVHHRLLCLRLKLGSGGQPCPDRSKAAAKAGGVFYTPGCVTRYMVARALESLQANPPRKNLAKPPLVVDPACGCGAFLLAAYRYLRDHLADNETGAAARRAILRRLHGVDLDGQAVLVARRALWLATADEPAGPLSAEETNVFFETIRPGNALVGPTLDPHVGTFDLVLGNPPYRRERGAKTLLDEIARAELGKQWRAARMDLWYYFAHRALELLRDRGIFSLVVSGYWTAGSGAAKLVEQLRRETHVEEIFDFEHLGVFDQVAGHHMILRARKTRPIGAPTVIKRPRAEQSTSAEAFLTAAAPLTVYHKMPDELFRDGRIDLEPVDHDLLEVLARGTPLGRLGRVRQGIAENPATVNRQTNRRHGNRWTPGQGVFVLTPEEVEALNLPERETSLLRPYHRPRELGRYRLAEQPRRTLIYATAETCPDIRAFRTIERHLARFRPIMEARRETRHRARPWWQLHWPRDPSLWTAEKILSVQMARRPAFVAAPRPVYVNFSVNVFVPDRSTREHLLYLTALLNSRPLWQWYRHHAKRRGVGLEINGRVLRQTPIHRIDFADTTDRRRHDELVELAAELMRETGRVCACTHLSDGEKLGACEHAPYVEPTEEIERRIDQIVCQLYGLREKQVDSS